MESLRVTTRRKRFPWISLALLLIAYTSFGWFLSGPAVPNYSLVLAVVWSWLLCTAFIQPISNFSRFVSRRFKSDTVAFLTICMMAGLAAVILFWMHIFLHILTIVATEALARIDIQTSGYANRQAFLILFVASLIGLGLGWGIRDLLPTLMESFLPLLPAETESVSLLSCLTMG